METFVGVVLIAGLTLFLVGAARWRLAYEQPSPQVLHTIHVDRRRRAWIHGWMVPGVLVTAGGTAGIAGLAAGPAQPAAFMAAMLCTDGLPIWTGWTGVGVGTLLGAGFAVTRASGPFNPPFWAHSYTGMLGVVLTMS
jgi:hypothetical protein